MTINKSKIVKKFLSAVAVVLCGAALQTIMTACEDTKSYAEMLNDENQAVNVFLSDNKVINEIPADSVFLTGDDAPYYCLDRETGVYMQVIDPGDGEKPFKGQTVYIRFQRYPLSTYTAKEDMEDGSWSGNNSGASPTYFKFDDATDYNSIQCGTGLQLPLHFLRLNCNVNLVIKSQAGMTEDMSYVTPFLYQVRYFKSQL
ncbi:MAG: DUF4827 domain-containing protein [Clostridium sp.]|nr:DUF4827 domain-containing protein [Clostridium sp.]